MIAGLERRRIVFGSDNGLMWGEHRLRKKAVPYEGASRVPMVIRYDPLVDSRRGSSVRSPVLNIDIAPTVMDLFGGSPGPPVDGESLFPLLRGRVFSVRTRFVIEHAADGDARAYCGARTRRELFVRYASGEEEYYLRSTDPWALDNAIDRPRHADRIGELRAYARDRCRPRPPGFTWRT